MKALERCERNISALLKHHSIPVLELQPSQQDRCFYRVEPNALGARMAELVLANKFTRWDEVRNHGASALCGWREDVAKFSLQVILHEGGVVECDVDIFNPAYGIAPAIAHWVETLIPGKTDPARVERGLVARGIFKEVRSDA